MPLKEPRTECVCQPLAFTSSFSLAQLAAEYGFHDQAHMTLEWNLLAGCTPKVWIARELSYNHGRVHMSLGPDIPVPLYPANAPKVGPWALYPTPSMTRGKAENPALRQGDSGNTFDSLPAYVPWVSDCPPAESALNKCFNSLLGLK